MEKLVLRNVQSITAYHDHPYTPQIYMKDFVCTGNVRYLDLSYNDIVFIDITEMCWNSKLEELILDHNLISQMYSSKGGRNALLPLLKLAQRMKVVSINYCSSGSSYHNDLWNDDMDKINAMELEDVASPSTYASSNFVTSLLDASPSVSALTNLPLNFITAYGGWFEDMLKHCNKLKFSKLNQCVHSNKADKVCTIFNCLASISDVNDDICNEGDLALSVLNGKYTQQFCDSTCAYGIGIPMPRSLTKISFHDSGQHMNMYIFVTSELPVLPIDETVLCIDPRNNIETIDLTNTVFNHMGPSVGLFVFRGLKKLKFFSIQGCNFPFVINPLTFADMGSLDVIHIGGNNLSSNDILPSVLLQSNMKLSVINLSYANLRGIESDTFVSHKHLTTLDLSHNHLRSSSLEALDLSHNSIKYLNLSYNALTTLPAVVSRTL